MKIKKVVSYLVVIAIFGFLLFNIYANWAEIKSFPWRFKSTDFFFLLLFLFPIYFLNVFAWHLVTRAVGADVKFWKNLQVWMLSNVARFLPGGFWQYPGRVLLLSKEGPTKTLASTAVVVESIFNLSVGSLIVFAGFVFLQLPIKIEPIKTILLLVIFLPIVLSALSSQKVASRLADIFQKLTGRGHVLKSIRLPFKWIVPLTIAFFFQYLFAGTALFFLVRGAVELTFSTLPVFIAIFAASWLLGYLTLFAPGGLGVQEASIAGLLSFYMPFSIASTIAIIFRIALILVEIVFLGIAFWLLKERS